MDPYRKLLTRAVASLSPNEATRIGPSADGDVVRLIAALPCASGTETRCLGISSYDYARHPSPAYREIKERTILRKAACLYIYYENVKERKRCTPVIERRRGKIKTLA